MAIVGGLFAALGRFAGKVVTMLLGWASILLFGRVPQSKQTLLAMITLGSLAWVVTLVGVLMPDVGAFLLTAVPTPSFIDDGWVRLAMVALAIGLPLGIGILTVMVLDGARRPTGMGLVVQVLRGYLYAPVLAITLVALAGIAIWRKGRALASRWEDAHVAVIVKPGGYDQVVADVERAIDDAGVDVHREAAPRALTIPPRLLAAVGGPAVAALVPDELVSLDGPDVSILVYPSDIALLGEKGLVARCRAAIVARLTHTEAYLTASEESQSVEDRVAAIGRGGAPATPETFHALDEELSDLVIPYDEWETLYRLRLQVENETRLPDASEPGTGAPALAGAGSPGRRSAPSPDGIAAFAVVGLLALDVALLLVGRLGRASVRSGR